MGTPTSCIARQEVGKAGVQADQPMTYEGLKAVIDGRGHVNYKLIQAMATEQTNHINLQLIIILHDNDTTLIIPRPWRR